VIMPRSPLLCQNGTVFNLGNRKVARGQFGQVKLVANESHANFRQKFHGEKGSVRQCIVD
jgi:hypothetical protein